MEGAVPLTPASVLDLLAGVAADGEPPRVIVHLAGGQALDGILVRVGTDHGADVVLLSDERTGGLSYLLLSQVAAVEVRNPGPFTDLLTGGKIPLPTTGPPVSRLALQREFGPTANFPLQVDWAAVGPADSVLGNLAVVLRAVRAAVDRIRSDDLGREAWGRVETLAFEPDACPEPVVASRADGLLIRANLSAALPRALTDELYRKISALL